MEYRHFVSLSLIGLSDHCIFPISNRHLASQNGDLPVSAGLMGSQSLSGSALSPDQGKLIPFQLSAILNGDEAFHDMVAAGIVGGFPGHKMHCYRPARAAAVVRP